jgi:3',5'-cyclic AMP phosphodiesterase CpdA
MASCADKPFVIIQIADAQLGFDAAVKGQVPGAEYVNDLTYETAYLQQAVGMVNGLKADAVVFTGDQVNKPEDVEQWDTFADAISEIDSNVSVFHIPGNHDVLLSEGKVDVTPFSSRYGDDRFVYSDKKVCIVGINSNLIKSNDPREEEQFEWMRSVLEAAGEDVVKLVFCHHPFFLTDIEEEDGYFQIQKSRRQEYFDLCMELDVDAMYAGHLHNNSEGSYNGLPVRTTTSVAFQIGPEQPSIRIITICDGTIKDQLRVL